MKRFPARHDSVFYDGTASGYNELYGREQARKLAIVKSNVRIRPETRLLDVGCGTGLSSDFGCFVVGVDPSIELIKLNPNKKVRGVGEKLPFKDNSFDFVVSLTAIHNFTDYESAIMEMARVSRHYIIIGLLKRAKGYEEIAVAIRRKLRVEKTISEEKDTLFFCAKYK